MIIHLQGRRDGSISGLGLGQLVYLPGTQEVAEDSMTHRDADHIGQITVIHHRFSYLRPGAQQPGAAAKRIATSPAGISVFIIDRKAGVDRGTEPEGQRHAVAAVVAIVLDRHVIAAQHAEDLGILQGSGRGRAVGIGLFQGLRRAGEAVKVVALGIRSDAGLVAVVKAVVIGVNQSGMTAQQLLVQVAQAVAVAVQFGVSAQFRISALLGRISGEPGVPGEELVEVIEAVAVRVGPALDKAALRRSSPTRSGLAPGSSQVAEEEALPGVIQTIAVTVNIVHDIVNYDHRRAAVLDYQVIGVLSLQHCRIQPAMVPVIHLHGEVLQALAAVVKDVVRHHAACDARHMVVAVARGVKIVAKVGLGDVPDPDGVQPSVELLAHPHSALTDHGAGIHRAHRIQTDACAIVEEQSQIVVLLVIDRAHMRPGIDQQRLLGDFLHHHAALAAVAHKGQPTGALFLQTQLVVKAIINAVQIRVYLTLDNAHFACGLAVYLHPGVQAPAFAQSEARLIGQLQIGATAAELEHAAGIGRQRQTGRALGRLQGIDNAVVIQVVVKLVQERMEAQRLSLQVTVALAGNVHAALLVQTLVRIGHSCPRRGARQILEVVAQAVAVIVEAGLVAARVQAHSHFIPVRHAVIVAVPAEVLVMVSGKVQLVAEGIGNLHRILLAGVAQQSGGGVTLRIRTGRKAVQTGGAEA